MGVEYRVGSDGEPRPVRASAVRVIQGLGAPGVTLPVVQISSFTSSAADILDLSQVAAFIFATGSGGTNPTMTVQFQDSPDDLSYVNITGAVETLTTNNLTKSVRISVPTGRFVRATGSIGGTNPTFSAFAVHIVGKT